MKDHQQYFSIDQMAHVLEVSRSSYYKFLKYKPSKRFSENDRLLNKIKDIHQASHQIYGSPRIHAELIESGERCSRDRVARLMRTNKIQAKMYKKFKKTTKQSDQPYYCGQDLVPQNFSAPSPDKVWVADITYVKINTKWCYLAIVLDLFSRKVVGMALRDNMKTDLILEALNQALLLRKPPAGLIHHSDLGSQYTSHELAKVAQAYGIKLSHGKTGCAYDNAAMESFFHTIKTEHIYFKRYDNLEAARLDIFDYIFRFYNSKRKHSTLNYKSPNQVEQQYYSTNFVSLHFV